MSAIIKCYNDPECTDELFFEVQSYSISLGPKTGLNGDTGEVVSQYIYLKNVGDVTAQNTVIKEVGDLSSYFKISTPLVGYADLRADVGNIAPNEVVEVILHSIIPTGTKTDSGIINYTIEYYTLPGVPQEQVYNSFTLSPAKLYYANTNIPDDAKAGRPYGYGPYGDPLYGQEGFIHKITTINGDLPVAGLNATYINATFSINARYDGTEATIEDVQSYYTSVYMALACFDGPALPLWLSTDNGEVLT